MPKDIVGNVQDLERKRLRKFLDGLRNSTSSIGQITGQAILNTNVGDNATSEAGAVGGALQFGGLGLGQFGLLGGLGGGLLGSILGGITGGLQENNNMERDRIETRNRLYSRSIGDGSGLFGKGGYIDVENLAPGDELSGIIAPIQAEYNEIMVREDGSLVDVHSDEMHSDMSKNKVTDFASAGDYILSNKLKLSQKNRDRTIGYSTPVYEEGKGNYKAEPIELSDYVNESDETIADAGKTIRRKFKVKDQKRGLSYLDDVTNKENIRGRRLPIQALLASNEQAKGDIELDYQDITPIGQYLLGGLPLNDLFIRNNLLQVLGDPNLLNELTSQSNGSFTSDQGADTITQMAPLIQREGNSTAAASAGSGNINDILDSLGLSGSGLDNLLERSNDILDQDAQAVVVNGEQRQQQNRDIFSMLGSNDLISLVGSTVALGAQSTTPKVRLRRPEFIEERFRGFTPQQISAQSDAILGQGENIVKSFQGAEGVAASVAPILFSRLLNRSAGTRENLAIFNRQQEQAKYNELANVNDFNQGQLAAADEQSRKEVNQKIAQGSQILGNYINSKNQRLLNEDLVSRQIDSEVGQNLSNISSQRLTLDVINAQTAADRDLALRRLKQFKDAAQQYTDKLNNLKR
jgi:hypothetical protein